MVSGVLAETEKVVVELGTGFEGAGEVGGELIDIDVGTGVGEEGAEVERALSVATLIARIGLVT